MNINFKNIKTQSSSDENDLSILIDELDKLVFLFSKSSIFKQLDESSDENHHTELLVKYLTYTASNRFTFFNQPSQKERRSVDIGIYLTDDKDCNYIFCVEAKYLPSNDYVIGNYAAIKRFKKCEHGLSNRNGKPLLENGIVAYIKKGKLEDHRTKINKKIISLSSSKKTDEFNLTWSKTEELKKTKIDGKLISNHLRINTSNMKLHHFWVVATKSE